MSRKNFCQACSNEKFGVKTRLAVEHTCGKELNPKEPEAVHGNEAEKEVCRSCFPTGIVPTDTKTIDIIEGGKTVLHRIR